MGRAVSGFGESLFDLSIKIQKQEDVLELSDLKRKIDESGFALFNSATGDEKTDLELWNKFEQNLNTIKSKHANVDNLLTEQKNAILPQWKDVFDKKGLAIRKQNVNDRFNLEEEKLLADANKFEYFKLLNTRLKLKDISKAEYDFKVANYENNSIIQQMRMLIGEGQPQDAIELSKLMTKDASADQMENRDRLIGIAEQKQSLTKKQLEIQREKDRGELYDLLYEGILTREKIESTSLDEDEQQKFWLMVKTEAESRIKEEVFIDSDVDTFKNTVSSLIDFYRGIKTRNDILDEAAEARFKNRNLSDKDYDFIKNNIDNKYPQDIVAGLEAGLETGKRIKEPGLFSNFSFSLFDWVNKQVEDKKPISAQDIYTYSRTLMPFYLNLSQNRQLHLLPTPEEIAEGELPMEKEEWDAANKINKIGSKLPSNILRMLNDLIDRRVPFTVIITIDELKPYLAE